MPTRVRVTFHNVTIAAVKTDGSPWDGMGSPRPDVAAQIARLLSLPNAQAAVVGYFAGGAISALERPEPSGAAMLLVDGIPGTPTQLAADARDTLTPNWKPEPSWSGVPLQKRARLQVNLMDLDLLENDHMGTFQLQDSDFTAALEAGNVYQARVSEQTSQQVLFAGISVFGE